MSQLPCSANIQPNPTVLSSNGFKFHPLTAASRFLVVFSAVGFHLFGSFMPFYLRPWPFCSNILPEIASKAAHLVQERLPSMPYNP
jgi:hypothetical protein